MQNAAKLRILMWGTVGLIVATSWGLYFSNLDKADPVQPLIYTLVDLTQPVVTLVNSYSGFPRGLQWTVMVNAVTYALFGLLVESFRRPRPLRSPN
jgi:hypothetical protein